VIDRLDFQMAFKVPSGVQNAAEVVRLRRRTENRNRTTSTTVSVILPLLICMSSVAAAADPEVIVETDRETVFLGESFIYQVTLNHVENPSEPDLSSFKDVRIEKLGEQSLNSRSITIIDGVRREENRLGRLYQYRLTPTESGNLTIPAPFVVVDDERFAGRSVRIHVVPRQDQNTVLLETTIDKASVYPMQSFTVTLTVSVAGLPKPRTDQDPLSILSSPPKLEIPWFTDDEPGGIDPEESWQDLLRPITTRKGGFALNSIDDSSLSIFRQRTIGFRPQPKRVTTKNDDGDEIEYWVYTFHRTFIPKVVGEYAFGPVTAKGSFVTGIRGQRFKVDDIFAAAEPQSIVVKDVPAEGRPDNWSGAIGRFELTAALTPTNASVGDPLTLRLTIKGEGTIENTAAPELSAIPEIADNFKIYDATQDTSADGSGKTFTYSLRPVKTGLSMFPAIELPTFDVEREEYVRLVTQPIHLELRAAETLSAADIVAAEAKNSDPRLPTASEDGIFGNDSNVVTLRNEAVRPIRWVLGWLGLLTLGLVSSAASSWWGKRNRDTLAIRKRNAFSRVNSSIELAGSSVDAIQAAVVGLVADLTGCEEAGLAARDAREKLRDVNVDATIVENVGAFLDRCDAARYGAASTDQNGLQHDAELLVRDLKTAMRQTG
jgi:hypothetical protein